jgi:aspartate/methionine/tyrosine aminotransferase
MFQKLDVPVEPFCELLRREYETVIVPGRFFGAADHVRIGFAGDTEVLREGLKRLRAALSDYA